MSDRDEMRQVELLARALAPLLVEISSWGKTLTLEEARREIRSRLLWLYYGPDEQEDLPAD